MHMMNRHPEMNSVVEDFQVISADDGVGNVRSGGMESRHGGHEVKAKLTI